MLYMSYFASDTAPIMIILDEYENDLLFPVSSRNDKIVMNVFFNFFKTLLLYEHDISADFNHQMPETGGFLGNSRPRRRYACGIYHGYLYTQWLVTIKLSSAARYDRRTSVAMRHKRIWR